MAEPADRLDAVLSAVAAACEGEGEDLVVNLGTLEELLIEAEIPVKTLNRGSLLAELSVVRDERRVQRTRAANSEGAAKTECNELVRRLDAREDEIMRTLWPAR